MVSEVTKTSPRGSREVLLEFSIVPIVTAGRTSKTDWRGSGWWDWNRPTFLGAFCFGRRSWVLPGVIRFAHGVAAMSLQRNGARQGAGSWGVGCMLGIGRGQLRIVTGRKCDVTKHLWLAAPAGREGRRPLFLMGPTLLFSATYVVIYACCQTGRDVAPRQSRRRGGACAKASFVLYNVTLLM
jgi:hypothetical protein